MGTESEQESLASANLAEVLRDGEARASENSAFWDDDEVREVVTFLESLGVGYEETEEHGVLEYRQRTESFKKAVDGGNVSKMQHGVGWLDNSEVSTDDGMSRLKPYLRQEACIVAIVGPPNSGKTNTALYLGDEWSKDTGGRMGTNVPIREPWNEVFPVLESEEDVKDWMSERDGRALFVGDEYGTEGGASSGENPHKSERFTQFARGIRKDPYHGNLILIGHRDNDLNAAMRDLVTVVVEKRDQMNKPEAYVWTDGFTNFSRGGDGWDFKMRVPETRLKYKDRNPVFEFDDGEDDAEDQMSKAERVRIAQTLLLKSQRGKVDMTQKEIADEVGRSPTWMSLNTDPEMTAKEAVQEFT